MISAKLDELIKVSSVTRRKEKQQKWSKAHDVTRKRQQAKNKRKWSQLARFGRV